MDLCHKYLFDFVDIYPPMNDYLVYKKFLKRKGILPNHLSKNYKSKENKLIDKYKVDLKEKNRYIFVKKF